VRRRLLNNRHAPDILPQLERLAGLGIRVHTQVVLCGGFNDGAILERTIADLARLHPAVQSVSVVPVGLTRYSRAPNIRRPNPKEAAAAVRMCEQTQTDLRVRLGVGFVYPSDELYLLAGRKELPPAVAYDGFPVLSNGVGMLRHMLDEWQRLLRSRPTAPQRDVAWITGRLASPALDRMADMWHAQAGWRPTVTTVENSLFGDQVTVSGLLSGADLLQAVRSQPDTIEDIVLPRGAFGFDGQHTLDGVSAAVIGAAHHARVHLASAPRELLHILAASS